MAGRGLRAHQAAIPSVPRSVKDPVTSNRANVDATLQRPGRRARRRRPSGWCSRGPRPRTATRRRCPSTRTCREPAVAVRAAEGRRRAVPADVHHALRPRNGEIRYFNVFGPRQDPHRRIRRDLASSPRRSSGPPPTIYGDGEQTRDFTYVANVVFSGGPLIGFIAAIPS